ncbi:MAG: lipopolysaccharide biosynthesis protein [Pseudonocardia sp.]|nr:lipopolysaccharide biosynthesis protein [Pseudonocardia sp.]
MGSGLLVNAYLAIIARTISAAEYAYFGAFWSLVLVTGFGMFLPIEQETARLLQVPDRPRGLLRASLLTAASLAAGQVVLVAAAAPWLARAFGGHASSVVAIAVLCLISAGQFVVRGALVGLDRMDRYALVMVLDTLLRVAFAGAVALLIADPGSSTFAWTLVAAVGLSHAPQLYLLATRRVRLGSVPAMGECTVTVGKVRRAVAPLLLGSLCAQVLLNGPPVLIPALATNEAEITRAGQFIAAFTLARVPLFLVVPLQTALLPSLTALLHSGDRAALRRVMLHIAIGIVGLGVAAVVLGYFAGPPLVGLIFGKSYVLGGRDVALLAVGVAGYIGLVLVTQVLVAAVRHRLVAWSWLSGVAVAAVILFTVPDLLLAAELAFLAGSVTGWLVGTLLVLTTGRRERELQRA